MPEHGLDTLKCMGCVPPVAFVARAPEGLLVFGLDHLLQHVVLDVTQLERRRLGGDSDAVEDMRASLVHAGEACLRGFVALLLSAGDD